MKKFIVGIFAVFYLAISSGFTVHIHYCMDKLAGWNLFHSDKGKCSTCGMHKDDSKGCCKDEQKVVKFTNDQKITDNSFTQILQLSLAIITPVFTNHSALTTQSELAEIFNLPPPYLRSVPVFVHNCNFRI